jgi:acetyltransferase-like isoleucine patch superfamily enzyme
MLLFIFKNKWCSFVFKTKLFCYGVTFGKGISALGGVCPQVRISKDAKEVCFGDNVTFNNFNDAGWNSKCAIWVRKGAVLRIGDNSGMNGALVYASNSVTIGSYVKIGGSSRIFDTDFHPLCYEKRRVTNEGTYSLPVIIEDDVFIGAYSTILKGVTIGARSIIAAGSVVTKSVPSDELWGGNPAKFIRKLS